LLGEPGYKGPSRRLRLMGLSMQWLSSGRINACVQDSTARSSRYSTNRMMIAHSLPQAPGIRGSLYAIVDAELGVDPPQVRLHRPDPQAERGRDLLNARPGLDVEQNGAFALGQSSPPAPIADRTRRRHADPPPEA